MLPRSIEIRRNDGAVAPLAGAAAGLSARSGLLVVLRDADGTYGLGEASPLPGYSPDTIDECARELARVRVDALPVPGDAHAESWLDAAIAASRVRAPAAAFALETALLDWLGRRRSAGVAAMLAGEVAARRELPISSLVANLDDARAAWGRGVRALKLKISPETFDADVDLARALRAEFGAAITLRFDANRRLEAAGASERLRILARLDPEIVEEPLASFDALPPGEPPVPLAADESLAIAGEWPRIASRCRAVVLKPTLLGGFGACLRLARDAARRGLAATVTHTFDGPVALAAAAELAVSLPGTVLACGLDPHRGLDAWPPVRIPQVRGDRVASAGGPGLALPLVGD